MRYSVLMSVYKNDSPLFLKVALESIYERQSKKPDEIVVVFDGPISAELLEVLKNFREGKEGIVKYLPQKENHGLGEALRIGSEYCTGDYIFRMDSDDISDPSRFEIQSLFVESHPEFDVVGADISEFNESPLEPNLRKRICPESHDDILRMGKKRNPMNHVTVCIKRDSLMKAGGYLPLKYVEDYYLWIRMMHFGYKFANIHKSLVYVRVGNGFAQRRGYKEQITSWRLIQDFMVNHGMITKKQAKRNMFYIKAFVKTPGWVKKILYSTLLRE